MGWHCKLLPWSRTSAFKCSKISVLHTSCTCCLHGRRFTLPAYFNQQNSTSLQRSLFLNRANTPKYLFGHFKPTLKCCLFTWPLQINTPERLGRDKHPILCFLPHQLMIIKTLPFTVFTHEITEQTNNLGTIKQKLSARYINTTVILAHSWLNV